MFFFSNSIFKKLLLIVVVVDIDVVDIWIVLLVVIVVVLDLVDVVVVVEVVIEVVVEVVVEVVIISPQVGPVNPGWQKQNASNIENFIQFAPIYLSYSFERKLNKEIHQNYNLPFWQFFREQISNGVVVIDVGLIWQNWPLNPFRQIQIAELPFVE